MTFIIDFAAWLLNAEVRSVMVSASELLPTTDPIRSDLVFHVTLADGRIILLHIEFQGRTTHRPMLCACSTISPARPASSNLNSSFPV